MSQMRVSIEWMESYLNSLEVLKIVETACQLHPRWCLEDPSHV